MFLLTNAIIRKNVRSKSREYLYIRHFSDEMLQHTSYYFRLGSICRVFEKGKSDPDILELGPKNRNLNVKPNQYVVVRSLEEFFLSSRVIGIFGQHSELRKYGLDLSHGPFIDPYFEGALELGLWNHLDTIATISFEDRIGKVCFFDISDTYPVTPPGDTTLMGETYMRRRPQRDDDPPHEP